MALSFLRLERLCFIISTHGKSGARYSKYYFGFLTTRKETFLRKKRKHLHPIQFESLLFLLSLIMQSVPFPSSAHWTLLILPLVPQSSLPLVFSSLWLPLTPSRHTYTANYFAFSFTLISQGSIPVLLPFILTTYFASGFSILPVQLVFLSLSFHSHNLISSLVSLLCQKMPHLSFLLDLICLLSGSSICNCFLVYSLKE